MAQLLSLGSHAPAFTLPGNDGKHTALRELLGQGPVVIYFYPKDDTTGCTIEACSFRDSYEVFRDAGATVVGISSDSVASHQAFAGKYRLPFLLLSDMSGDVRRAFGVPKTLGLLAGRVTFVLDGEGVIRHVTNSQLSPAKHIREALEVVRQLKGAEATATATSYSAKTR